MHCDQARIDQAQLVQACERAHAILPEAVLDLAGGFVHMDVDWQVELGGKRGNALESLVADRVGRMRGEAEREQGLVSPGIAYGQALWRGSRRRRWRSGSETPER